MFVLRFLFRCLKYVIIIIFVSFIVGLMFDYITLKLVIDFFKNILFFLDINDNYQQENNSEDSYYNNVLQNMSKSDEELLDFVVPTRSTNSEKMFGYILRYQFYILYFLSFFMLFIIPIYLLFYKFSSKNGVIYLINFIDFMFLIVISNFLLFFIYLYNLAVSNEPIRDYMGDFGFYKARPLSVSINILVWTEDKELDWYSILLNYDYLGLFIIIFSAICMLWLTIAICRYNNLWHKSYIKVEQYNKFKFVRMIFMIVFKQWLIILLLSLLHTYIGMLWFLDKNSLILGLILILWCLITLAYYVHIFLIKNKLIILFMLFCIGFLICLLYYSVIMH